MTCSGTCSAWRAAEEGPCCPKCDSTDIEIIAETYDREGLDEAARIECNECNRVSKE